MSLKLFSEDYGREISKELLTDINARAGLPSDANGAESTTEQVVVRLPVVLYILFFLHLHPSTPPLTFSLSSRREDVFLFPPI